MEQEQECTHQMCNLIQIYSEVDTIEFNVIYTPESCIGLQPRNQITCVTKHVIRTSMFLIVDPHLPTLP